jgi:polyisoprenoid-binding protein YceI
MKTLFFSLLLMFHAWSGRPVVSLAPAGGVSVLAVNTTSSAVGWKAEKATGTHTGAIKISSGELVMHCGQLYSGTVILDLSSITVTDLSQPDKRKLETNLRSDYFFDAGKYPEARLEITSVNHSSEKTLHFVTILANLMMHGITKQITFTADVSKSAVDAFTAEANIVINRRDWNIATSNVMYNNLIYKDIRLHVQLQAGRPEPKVS